MVKLNWDSHCCSVQFICSIVYDSFQPHGLQHARLPHAIINSRNLLKLMSIELVMPSNHLFLCHPFLLLPSIFPSIRSFPVSQFFVSGSQSIWASASASVLSTNTQGWFPLGLTGLISLKYKEILKNLLQHHNLKASFLRCSAFFMVQLSHVYMTTGKKHNFD